MGNENVAGRKIIYDVAWCAFRIIHFSRHILLSFILLNAEISFFFFSFFLFSLLLQTQFNFHCIDLIKCFIISVKLIQINLCRIHREKYEINEIFNVLYCDNKLLEKLFWYEIQSLLAKINVTFVNCFLWVFGALNMHMKILHWNVRLISLTDMKNKFKIETMRM